MLASLHVKPAMIVVLTLLLLFYAAGYANCSTVPQSSTEDILSLIEFRREITSYPRGFFRSWNSSVHYCSWNGITCSTRHPGRVRDLKLSNQSLEGRISPSLGNLTFLRVLDLSSNSFSGQLPILNGLRRLQGLFLNNNLLQGFISPDALINCSNLHSLYLSSNMLDGPIPPSIGLLSNLTLLYLSTNNFTGVIPSSLGNISKLEELDLSYNQLEGNIPEELGRLSYMNKLTLTQNRLAGRVPTTIFNLSSIGILDLGANFLHMALPSNIGDTLPSLLALSLYNNRFHGRIPASLGNATFLLEMDFTSNNFTGHVPSSLGNLTHLSSLKLEQNNLEAKDSEGWEFLDALGKCTSLTYLSLSDNNLQGAIPKSVGQLSNSSLQYLGLGKNNLSGTVPESIGNLIGLNQLALDQNNLTGPIGSWVGKLNNLVQLSLRDNKFSGPIPSSIGSFTKLTHLFLDSNEFEGPIPPSLGKLQHLLELNFSNNNLQDPIPRELFSPTSSLTKCAFSYNNLEGPIHPEVRNLQQLNELDLSSNKLSGEIPSTLGECRELLILKMDCNSLTGNISPLSSLTSLNMLNLSHNNLSGLIPVELGTMSSLTQLDLSYNDLQGVIPRDGVFRNASAVSLVGNRGLCGGTLDLHMPPCPTASRGKGKQAQYYLIRVLIPIFGFMSLLMLVYFVLTEKWTAQGQLLNPLGDQFPIVSYSDLVQATQNFSKSNLIGRGGSGSVYRGNLMKTKLEVAIKVLDIDMGLGGAERSFLSECEAFRNIRHRNLVPIITACSTVDINGNAFRALVYEFMPNGNLESWLHLDGNRKSRKPLGLNQRTCISVNIADVLDYLHHESGKTIIHCDVKPSNILLDDDMNARLGDFGIAKFYLDFSSASTRDAKTTSSTGVKGTIGYIPPGIYVVLNVLNLNNCCPIY